MSKSSSHPSISFSFSVILTSLFFQPPQAVKGLKKKIKYSKTLYLSHIEAVQNVVSLHKASSVAGLEEISCSASSNAQFLEEVSDYLSFWLTSLMLY